MQRGRIPFCTLCVSSFEFDKNADSLDGIHTISYTFYAILFGDNWSLRFMALTSVGAFLFFSYLVDFGGSHEKNEAIGFGRLDVNIDVLHIGVRILR